MLVQAVAERFAGKVDVVNEDFGASELAERFGVARYPAVFVNEVLVAKPKDFGFFGERGSQGAGRYTPWLDPASHERFQEDLERFLNLALAGELEAGVEASGDLASDDGALTALPEFEVKGLDGATISNETLRGNVTIVEFWASWCPPCIKAMPWLADLQERHADDLNVVTIAVESREEDIRGIVERMDLSLQVVLGTPELARSFGDLTAVPTMFVFDREGKLVKSIFGAPPGLYDEIDALVASLAAQGGGKGR